MVSFQNERGDGLDPSSTVLHNERDVVEYLKKHHVLLPPNIVVEWCHPDSDVKVPPPEGGVYFHPQVLALGVHLPLTVFVCQVLAYYDVASTQLTSDAWQTVLAFEALCMDFAFDSYSAADFATCYSMRKLSYGSYSFIP